jgi:hypothetical protein
MRLWPLGGYPAVDKYGAEADEKALGMQKQLDGPKIYRETSWPRRSIFSSIHNQRVNSAQSASASAAVLSTNWLCGCRN